MYQKSDKQNESENESP